ncbi:MAG: hypothetical protein ACT4PI_12435 [Actinomycetota bacterium]
MVTSPDRHDTEREMTLKAMEPGMRDDLATKADLLATTADLRAEIGGVKTDLEVGLAGLRAEMSDLRATVESKLRGQTWTMVTVLLAGIGASRFL